MTNPQRVSMDVMGPQYRWTIEGLGCPNCAARMERAIARYPEVIQAQVVFGSAALTLTLRSPVVVEDLERRILATIRAIESGVSLSRAQQGVESAPGSLIGNTHSHESGAHKHSVFGELAVIAGGLALMLAALLLPLAEPWRVGLYAAAYALTGLKVLWHAVKSLIQGQWFDENFLMGVATLGAFAIGEYPEGVAVMVFYRIGEFFQELAVGRSRRSISQLMRLKADTANLLNDDGSVQTIALEQALPGQRLLVRPGERVPLDGVVLEGASSLDTSGITGESIPRDVQAGDEILSGCINQEGTLIIEASSAYADSTVARILRLLEESEGRRARQERFITRFARVYTPVVVGCAALLAVGPPLILGHAFSEWIYRALLFLVVSCPCALVVSVPLSYFAGIGRASREGVLLKGGVVLDALRRVDTVVFDKTGTLTTGAFEIQAILPAAGIDPSELLAIAAAAERSSTHPLAQAIVAACPDAPAASVVTELRGQGVVCAVNGHQVCAGNARLLSGQGVTLPERLPESTSVLVARGGIFIGSIVLMDQLKSGAADSVMALNALGIRKTALLTGDREASGRMTQERCGIMQAHCELLPQDKVEQVETMRRDGARVLFVGDGMNDAPVLALSDVGIAIGGIGSDAAIEAADAVLMTGRLDGIPRVIKLSRRTHRVIVQNIAFSLAIKALVMTLGVMGLATMWEAVFADVGVTLLAVLNAMRLLAHK